MNPILGTPSIAIPEGFTKWDKTKIYGPLKLK